MAAWLAAHTAGRTVALRTSGSSGRPRCVVRTTRSWVVSFPHVARLTGLTTESRVWVPGPLTATMNLFAAALARSVGADVVDDPGHATHAHLTPLALGRALDGDVPLTRVHLTVAGDRLPRSLRERAEAAGATVSHYYGAAELSFVAWGTDDADLRAFPEVEIGVRRDEIWVRSPYLCQGYDGPPGVLRRDRDGFASVGDRGELRGGTLTVWGRGSDAVTTAGATVLVADVERVLREATTGDVAVVGMPHPTVGQVVSAVLTRAQDLLPAVAAARTALDGQQRPRKWYHLTHLPTTAAGKVDRVALGNLLATGGGCRLDPVSAAAGSAPGATAGAE